MTQHRKRKTKYPQETVIYKCPKCGREARNTGTQKFNKIWLENITGTVCPDCEKK